MESKKSWFRIYKINTNTIKHKDTMRKIKVLEIKILKAKSDLKIEQDKLKAKKIKDLKKKIKAKKYYKDKKLRALKNAGDNMIKEIKGFKNE